MNKPKISIICCISKNRGIGKDNKLLFDIPEDLKHFKKITMGHPIIMGYNTYQSIGKPLPGRLNIILSKDKIEIPGCSVGQSIEEAIEIASQKDKKEIFFIGGGMVYKQAIVLADRLYLTIVDAKPEADTFFPDYYNFNKIVSEENNVSENSEADPAASHGASGRFPFDKMSAPPTTIYKPNKYKFMVLEREPK